MTRKPTYEELKQNINELEKKAAKRQQAVENSLTGIYIDQEEKIVFANNRFVEV